MAALRSVATLCVMITATHQTGLRVLDLHSIVPHISLGNEGTVCPKALRLRGGSSEALREENRRPNVLLGLTGSVASIKALELVDNLASFSNLRVVTTQKGAHFFEKDKIKVEVFTDEDEWALWKGRGDPVQHIDLRRWADLLIIAPLSANTLAKLATGLCDNLLTCTVRAWDFDSKPLLVAPAMNTAMWNQPCTRQHLSSLSAWGVEVIAPVRKVLMCGEDGVGAMAAVETINSAVRHACANNDGEHTQSAAGFRRKRRTRRVARELKRAASSGVPFLLGIAAATMWRALTHSKH